MYQEIENLPMDDSTNVELREYVHDLILKRKPQLCVEVGTHRGITALYMGKALCKNGSGKLITVDPFDYGVTQTLEQFPDVKPFVEYQQKKGIELDVTGIDFLFIDGFHEYEAVLAEIKHFLPRLNDKAHVLFHDCGGDNELVGVNKAIDEVGLDAPVIEFGEAKSRLYIHAKPRRILLQHS